eukprot:TRINITY_DN107_c0_g1_i1.p1 TRINITY_DN107_c0_g1~~TRINITY_DN107_c0_g1_i1.p1  ORF type:complete len:285 (-),score=91.22 TRINITY_DN107_c0_g1_i1:86-838(-)
MSSPQLSASPMMDTVSPKINDTAVFAPLDPSSSSSSSSSDEQRIAELQRKLDLSQARNQHLQNSLDDAIRSKQATKDHLLQVQWEQDEDQYVYRNPLNKSGSPLLDGKEQKAKELIERMRKMQLQIEELQGQNQDLKTRRDGPAEPIQDAHQDSRSAFSRSVGSPAMMSPGMIPLHDMPHHAPSPSIRQGQALSDAHSDSPVAIRPKLTRGGHSASDLSGGSAPHPSLMVASPAISSSSTKHVAARHPVA